MSFIIKPASENDAIAWTTTRVLSWKTAYKGIIPDDYLDNISIEEKAQKFEKNIVQNNDFEYLAAWLDDKMIGILVVGPCRDLDINTGETGEICGIYLHPDYFGKGYGYKLINHGISILRTRFKFITLWVLEENMRARSFYEKAGFRFDGTKKDIVFGKRLVEIRYILSLTV